MRNNEDTRRRWVFRENGDSGHNLEGVHTTPFPSNYNRLSYGHGYTPRQVERGQAVLARFETWKRDNPDARRHAVRYAVRKAREGERISAQAIIEDVRRIDYTDVHGKPTRTNNDFAPVMARWIAAEHPETAAHIELRRSIFDYLMGTHHGRG